MSKNPRDTIAELLCIIRHIEKEEADDIIQECQNAVNDFLFGENTEYSNVQEVIEDYLWLDEGVTAIFFYNIDKTEDLYDCY